MAEPDEIVPVGKAEEVEDIDEMADVAGEADEVGVVGDIDEAADVVGGGVDVVGGEEDVVGEGAIGEAADVVGSEVGDAAGEMPEETGGKGVGNTPSQDDRVVVGGALPLEELVAAKDNECAMGVASTGGICALRGDLEYLRRFLRQHDPKAGTYPPKRLVAEIQRRLGVGSESAIWEHPEFRRFVGGGRADEVLQTRYKIPGPHDSTRLLDDQNIDWLLEQWAKNSKARFGRIFHHVPYQMLDFAETGSELAHLDPAALRKQGYDCFGVVLNTDVHTGRGKHWFALFGDLKHKGTKEDPWRLEYFNSSGNPARPEVERWLEETRQNLLLDHGLYAEVVRSASQRLQYSNTECGMWSLLYLYSRLRGKPADWFYHVRTDDADMVEARRSVFREDTRKIR